MNDAPPLLRIRDLRTWYPLKKGLLARTVGHVKAVDGVSFDLADGEVLGLVGESGCGKTTLARTILRLEKPRSGTVELDGQDILPLRGAALRDIRRQIQVVFQDPLASLNPRLTVLELVTEAAVVHGLVPRDGRREAAARLLADVGMAPDALDRYPHAFSGGQRQRICIARALSLRPRLLLCDEAVSSLDLLVRAQVLNLLMELKERHGLSYLFITHDIGVVAHLADRIAVMHRGRIVEQGPAEELLSRPRHPYTQKLLSAVSPAPEAPSEPEASAPVARNAGYCQRAPGGI
ncbi:MAG: ABC transporter ATP-binding protein [Kiritimatiellia bacterium]|jgi:oligopeptide transport system ATP-binding protein